MNKKDAKKGDKNIDKNIDKNSIEMLHSQFLDYGKNARTWMRKCELLLPEIERQQVWRKKKFTSIYEYAAKLAGMSRHKVDDVLRILRKIEDKPELCELAEEKGLQRIRPVATIATKETAHFWAEKARDMSKHTLATYVHDYRLKTRPGTESQPEKSLKNIKNAFVNEDIDTKVTMELSSKILNQLRKLKGDGDWNALMETLLKQRDFQLEKAKPKSIKTKSRHIPIKIRQHVLNKTNNRCAFPTCNKKYEILHHTQRFAMEGTHDPDKIVPLCEAHERLMHLGLIGGEDAEPKNWHLLELPDKTNHKQFVDQQVWLHRKA